MVKKLVAAKGRVVVLPAPEEEVSAGGIVIPEGAKREPCTGTVISVGPHRDAAAYPLELGFELGDTVLFEKYAGVRFKITDETWVVLKHEDVLATIKEEASI